MTRADRPATLRRAVAGLTADPLRALREQPVGVAVLALLLWELGRLPSRWARRHRAAARRLRRRADDLERRLRRQGAL